MLREAFLRREGPSGIAVAFDRLCLEGVSSFFPMEANPHWKQPERWLAFFLTMLATCSFLAMVPVEPGLKADPAEAASTEGFIDSLREGGEAPRVVGHWTSLAPPLLAVLVALFFRSMVFALLSAFVAGSFLSFGLNPLVVATLAFHDYVWLTLTSSFNLYIFLFLFTLVGLVHLISRNGGLAGLVEGLGRFATSRRKALITIGGAGVVMFFDDYSNTVVLGNTMRKLSDKWRISREKLAYLVDSTTSPVAGLAVLSTWIAFEAMLLGGEAEALGIELSGYEIFLEMMPMRFYCIGTLIFLFMSSAMGRDFGPMLRAERRALEEDKPAGDSDEPFGIKAAESSEPKADTPRRWYNAAAPILSVVLGILGGILFLGRYRILEEGGRFSLFSFADWREAFGVTVSGSSGAGAMPILFLAAAFGTLVAFALTLGQKLMSVRESCRAFVSGMPTLWMAIYILLMTWAMRAICEDLGTAQYLIEWLGDDMPVWTLPLFTFAVAAAMSFATGTSWGAMGILIPIILPLAFSLGAYETGGGIVFFLTAAAILDGAIFGDHCSPISDTTALSSISSGCDHIAHVKTQLLYALTTMTLSGLIGYLAVGGSMPLWLFYVLFPLAAYGVLRFIGQRVVSKAEG